MTVVERIGSFDIVQGEHRESISDRHMHCAACENISYRGDQISAHELAVAAKLREMDGLLSAGELAAVRTKYKLTQREMELILGTGPKTWVRWERGKIVQSKLADRTIRLLANEPRLVRQVMDASGIKNEDATAVLDAFVADEKRLVATMLEERLERGSYPDLQRLADRAVEVVHLASKQVAAKAA